MKIKKGLICLVLVYSLIAAYFVQESILSYASGSGDVNNDGIINMADVILLATKFNSVSGDGKYAAAYDLNTDGVINMSDVIIIAGKFNTVVTVTNTSTKSNTPTSKPTPTFTSTPTSTQVPSKVNANEVLWIGDSWIQMPGTQHTRVRDLAPLFTGHPEYMGSDGIHPSDVGGTVVGNAVWDAMKKNGWF